MKIIDIKFYEIINIGFMTSIRKLKKNYETNYCLKSLTVPQEIPGNIAKGA